MKKNIYFIFIAASFALLAAAPGRLAYGLPLIIELNILMAAAKAFYSFAKKIDMGGLTEILTVSFVIFMTILFKQIKIFYNNKFAVLQICCIRKI